MWKDVSLKLILKNKRGYPDFFSIRFFFSDTDESQDSRGRKETIFYSTLPFPPAHKHSDIYLQICMWDDYHIFLIAPPGCYSMRFTTLSNYHLIDWWCDVDSCLFTCWFDSRILSTAIWHGKPTLQANRLSKCASHPNYFIWELKYFQKREVNRKREEGGLDVVLPRREKITYLGEGIISLRDQGYAD